MENVKVSKSLKTQLKAADLLRKEQGIIINDRSKKEITSLAVKREKISEYWVEVLNDKNILITYISFRYKKIHFAK